jgi:hypothetical protein
MIETNNNPIELDHAKRCLVCQAELTGRQSKYCSRTCHNQHGNAKNNCYENQQKRGLERKIELVNNHGKNCEKCGYNQNYAALCFHHKNPSEKSFPLDLRHCSNRTWETLLEESKKCQLLCVRCHAELHNPHLFV